MGGKKDTAKFVFHEKRFRKKETLHQKREKKKKDKKSKNQVQDLVPRVPTYEPTKRGQKTDQYDPDDEDNVDAQANIERFARFFKVKMSQKGKEKEQVQEDLIKTEIDAKEVIEADDVQGIGAELFMCQNPKCKTQVCPTLCAKEPCDCEPEKDEKDQLKDEANDSKVGDVCKLKGEEGKGFRHCDQRCKNSHEG